MDVWHRYRKRIPRQPGCLRAAAHQNPNCTCPPVHRSPCSDRVSICMRYMRSRVFFGKNAYSAYKFSLPPLVILLAVEGIKGEWIKERKIETTHCNALRRVAFTKMKSGAMMCGVHLFYSVYLVYHLVSH